MAKVKAVNCRSQPLELEVLDYRGKKLNKMNFGTRLEKGTGL